MIFYMIYESKPVGDVNREVLNGITEESIKWNSKHGITGILLSMESGYLQLLEGEERDVREVFDMIKEDPRHEKVTLRIQGFSKERTFTEWSMGSWLLSNEQLQELDAIQQIKEFIKDPTNNSLQSTKYMTLMNNLLQTWIDHEPERAKKLRD